MVEVSEVEIGFRLPTAHRPSRNVHLSKDKRRFATVGNLSDSIMCLAQPGRCVRASKGGWKEERVKQGKLQLGNEAVPEEYELQTTVANNKRETTRRLVLRQPPGIQLSTALTKMTVANLVTDDGQA